MGKPQGQVSVFYEPVIRAYARMSGLEARCVEIGGTQAKSYFIFLGRVLASGRPDMCSRFLACGDSEAEAWAKSYAWLREQDWALAGMAIAADMLCAEGRLDA